MYETNLEIWVFVKEVYMLDYVHLAIFKEIHVSVGCRAEDYMGKYGQTQLHSVPCFLPNCSVSGLLNQQFLFGTAYIFIST